MRYIYIILFCALIIACSNSDNLVNNTEHLNIIKNNIQHNGFVLHNDNKEIVIDINMEDIMTNEEIEKYFNENTDNATNYIYINEYIYPNINNNESINISLDKNDTLSSIKVEPQIELFVESRDSIINTNTNINITIE